MAGHGDSADTELSPFAAAEKPMGAGQEDENAESDGFIVDTAERSAHATVRLAVLAGLTTIVLLTALVGWLSHRTYQTHDGQQQRQQVLDVGRQAALNLTTIDFNEVDKDVSQILNSATGKFLDDFQQRSQSFIDVVRQAKSKSEGTVADAGIESIQGDQAQVLVAVQVKTFTDGNSEPQPHGWRLRVDVQKIGSEYKVADVQFVP